MSWLTIIRLLVVWYAVTQLMAWAVLPVTVRVLRALPDKGYSFAKIAGILLVGVVYWLGYSYGLLRNERGGAWLALVVAGVIAWAVGWREFVAWWRNLRASGGLRALITTEVIFLVIFVLWALVRAHDPNVDHTEEPMDLMFMNSIWASATYPPQDAWFAGYAISYYYFGYWLLLTVARLANVPPSIAYNVGQATWYALLWVGSFGVVMNLLAWHWRARDDLAVEEIGPSSGIRLASLGGGLLASVAVAFTGNLQVLLEWFYAQGVDVAGLARWVDVHNFPENASQTGAWYISFDWWWWRSSRVIEDVDLLGNHIDISPIDEFPMFSYLLGDNHPHVLAMPVVLLVIALAFNLLLLLRDRRGAIPEGSSSGAGWGMPLDVFDAVIYVAALGSLVFLNTWDFPPYWLLMVAVLWLGSGWSWRRVVAAGAMMLISTIVLYLPYFLTAQSQAGGIIPNVFHPTRFPQFLVMFGGMLPAVVGVLVIAWRYYKPSLPALGWSAMVALGGPIALLALSAMLASTAWGAQRIRQMTLPEGVTSYAAAIAQRWLSEPWTLLFVGALLAVALACVLSLARGRETRWAEAADLIFVVGLVAIGLALVYAPEFVYLRDNFGSRMNTVFKFYYQGWLLFALASAYLITIALVRLRREFGIAQGLALLSLVLIAGGLLFPIAGGYAKTGGFAISMPTLDSTGYVARNLPDVMAAVEWVRTHTTPDAIVLEARGNSYSAQHNRISTMTGRPTLLGWDGHQSQWRGDAYGQMAQGRPDAIEQIYRTAPPDEIPAIVAEWGIDYVFVGPTEIEEYGITPFRIEELGAAMDTVFARGVVRIFRPRGPNDTVLQSLIAD